MSKKASAHTAPDEKRSSTKKSVLTAAEAKTRLSERGLTLKAWAKANNYPYHTVSAVVRGVNRGTFGLGHRIATALGLK